MNWTTKYCPKKWNKLNYSCSNNLEEWLKNGIENNHWKPMMIIGGKNSGKKILAKLLFEKYNYNINHFDYNDKSNIYENVRKLLTNKNIKEIFFQNWKSAILISNLEYFLEDNDKVVLTKLIKLFNLKKHKKNKEMNFLKKIKHPLILTTTNEHTKKN